MNRINKNTASFIVLMLFCSIVAFSQGTPRGLESLINMRGSSAEKELELKGYKFIKTTKSATDSYQNWYHAGKRQCITCRINNGRVASIVDSKGDCGELNNDYNYNNNNYDVSKELGHLINYETNRARRELRNLGYDFKGNRTIGGILTEYWRNSNKNQCVSVKFKFNKVLAVSKSSNSDCNRYGGNNNNYGNNSTRELNYLVNTSLSNAIRELRQRGYEFKGAKNSGSGSNQFWWNANKSKCITCRVQNFKIVSISTASDRDCNEYGNSGYNKEVVTDLVYKDAELAYSKLRSRGFDEVKSHQQGGNTYRLWYNGRTNQCIKTTSRDKKITSVENSDNCDL